MPLGVPLEELHSLLGAATAAGMQGGGGVSVGGVGLSVRDLSRRPVLEAAVALLEAAASLEPGRSWESVAHLRALAAARYHLASSIHCACSSVEVSATSPPRHRHIIVVATPRRYPSPLPRPAMSQLRCREVTATSPPGRCYVTATPPPCHRQSLPPHHRYVTDPVLSPPRRRW